MKNLIVVIALVISIISCKKGPEPYLETSVNSLNFQTSGGEQALSISTNREWKASLPMVDWVTISPSSGTKDGQVHVIAKENNLVNKRTLDLVITADKLTKKATISQEEAPANITTNKTSENINSAAGSFAVEVTTNGASWTSSGVPNWITLSPANGSASGNVNATYQANTLAASRNATITFTSGSSSKSLTITQAAANAVLQINITKKQVGYQAGSVFVELTTNNAEWKITGLPAWIDANPLLGDKSGTITLNYQTNPLKEKRSASILFSAGNISQSLLFEQLTSIDPNDGGTW